MPAHTCTCKGISANVYLYLHMRSKSMQTCIQEYMYTHACTYILSNARARANGFRVDIQSSLQLVPPRSHMETHQKNVSDKTIIQIPLRTAHDVLIRTVCEHALITCVLLHVHALGPPTLWSKLNCPHLESKIHLGPVVVNLPVKFCTNRSIGTYIVESHGKLMCPRSKNRFVYWLVGPRSWESCLLLHGGTTYFQGPWPLHAACNLPAPNRRLLGHRRNELGPRKSFSRDHSQDEACGQSKPLILA